MPSNINKGITQFLSFKMIKQLTIDNAMRLHASVAHLQ